MPNRSLPDRCVNYIFHVSYLFLPVFVSIKKIILSTQLKIQNPTDFYLVLTKTMCSLSEEHEPALLACLSAVTCKQVNS